MTTPNGPILFNASGGSDIAASGLGPLPTAVSGTGASLNATSTVDLSADTPDLSGVSAGDLLWVDTTSGRQSSIIASVDDGADTVTCDDAFAVTESGRNWGIGGKRATVDDGNSRKLLSADAKGGWTVELEDDQTITGSALSVAVSGDYTNGPVVLRGASGAIRKLTQSGNATVLTLSSCVNVRFENIKIECSNATANIGVYGVSARGVFVSCEIGDATNQLNWGVYRGSGGPMLEFFDCWIHDCTNGGFYSDNSSVQYTLVGSVVSDNGGDGFQMTWGNVELHSCIVRDNTTIGVDLDNSAVLYAYQSTIHGNGGDGVEIGSSQNRGWIFGCNITGNGGYGVDAAGVTEFWLDHNNYGTGATANTSGAVNGVSQGPNDITVDPGYADAGNGDFAVGVNVKAKSFPGTFLDGNSTGYVDIGAVQRQEPAGGNQAKLRRIMYIGEGVLL